MAKDNQDMSYEELTSINRSQYNSGILIAVRKDLYPQIAKLIEKCRKDLMNCDPDSPEFAQASHANTETKKIAKDLINERMRKVVSMSLLGGSGGSNVVEALTPEERLLYEDIMNSTKKIYDSVFSRKKPLTMDISEPDAIPAPEMEKATVDTKIVENVVGEDSQTPATEVPVPMSEPPKETVPVVEEYDEEDAEECPVPTEQPAPEPIHTEPKADKDGMIMIRVLDDTPQFSGMNNVVYNLRKEDVVRMPAILATALINRGLAKPIAL